MDKTALHLSKLIDIGIALSSIRDIDKLLEMIVSEARSFTSSDAGSLYIKKPDGLHFVVSQNDTLAKRLGKNLMQAKFKPFVIPCTNRSIAGYVANTGEVLNIADVYEIPSSKPYSFNSDFDKRNNYCSKSMLVVPLKDTKSNILGVLQLINCLDGSGSPVSYGSDLEAMALGLASQAAVALSNAQLTQDLKQAHLDTIFRLSVAAEYRDNDTANHLRRMSNYSRLIAEKMGFTTAEQEFLLHAAPMHDVGKLGIPDSILQKPGRLTPEERKIMERHTIIGAEILSGSDSDVLQLSELIAIVHHEKYDGTGYPRGLKGEEIPLVGRIVALADVFDALSSARVYKPAVPWDKVLAIIREDTGKHFDPAVTNAFFDVLDEVRKIYDTYQDVYDHKKV
ncbi:MAG: HD domain-containing protein [Myxococcota bacterium]